MLDIEQFSTDAWCTPHAVMWNRRKGQGILYRGWYKIANSEYFRADEVKRKERVFNSGYQGRGETFGT